MLASVKAEAECAMCNDNVVDDEDGDATFSPFLSPIPPRPCWPMRLFLLRPPTPLSLPRESRLVSNRDDEKDSIFISRYGGRDGRD